MRQRLVPALIAALFLVLAADGARAENPARAKSSYKEGLLQYNLGDYDKALEKFKASYLDLPDPAFLFNIAQCQRQLGQYANASKSYRAFLRESPSISGRTRDDVQRLISEMDEAIRDARAKAPPTGMQPPRDDTTTTTTTTPPPVETTVVPPPPPSVPAVIIAAPPPPARPWYKNPAGMSLAVGGVCVLAIGGGLLGAAASNDSSSRNAMTLPDQNNFHSSAVTFQGAGLALIGIGAAATIAGGVVLALGARHRRAEVAR